MLKGASFLSSANSTSKGKLVKMYSEWSVGGVLICHSQATESVMHGQCDARPTVTSQP